MLKKYLFLLWLLIFSCFSSVLQAQSFSVANSSGTIIYYNILSSNPNRVAVAHTTSCYSGILIIPDTVFYSGTAYRVTAIADSAFCGCSSLVSVTMPATIDSVGEYVFWNTTNLASIHCLSVIPPVSTDNIYNGGNYSNLIVYVPCIAYNDYRFDTNHAWNTFQNISGTSNSVEYWDTICQTESYTLHGFSRYMNGNAISGIFDSTFHTENGCDYSITVHLYVKPSYKNEYNYYICNTSDIHYSLHGFDINGQTGSWYHNDTTRQGCDSTTILNIIQIYADTTDVIGNVCQGKSYYYGPFSVASWRTTTAGTIIDMYATVPHNNSTFMTYQAGCIETQHLILSVRPNLSDTTRDTNCYTSPFYWRTYGYNRTPWGYYNYSSHLYSYDTLATGNYTFTDTTFTTEYGCRNNHTLNLTVNPTYRDTIYDSLCKGERYSQHGFNFIANTSRIYIDTLHTIKGCDSIQTLNLTVNPVYNIQIRDTVCKGVLYSQHGFNVAANTVGTITRTNHLQTTKGCDSTLNLSLVVNPIFSDTTYKTKCEAAHYSWQPTGYIHNANGTYLPASHTYNYDTLADGSYIFRDTTLTTQYGCKNNHTLSLKINPIYDTTIHDTICQGTLYNKYGLNFVAQTSNVYSHTFTSVYGCDSIIRVNLRVNPVYINTTQVSICSGKTYNFYGRILSTTGSYRDTLQTVNGCDSIQILNLTVNPIYNNTINDNICFGGVYSNHGFHINADTLGTFTYIDTVQTIKGCDSILTLHLTVNPIYNIQLYDTVCKHTTYTKYGFNFIADTSGIHIKHLTTIHGCDSTLTLHLIVNPTYDTTIFAQVCANGTYIGNGFIESVAGTYTHHLQTINGCDSVLHLHLTINNQIVTTINDTICQGETYNQNGFTATLSGIYKDTLSSAGFLGCDSVIVLNLRVNPIYEKTIYDTICEREVYHEHSFAIGSSLITGDYIYKDTLISIHNCDSVQTLYLRVNPIYNMVLYDSICKGSRYDRHSFDFIATESKIYTDTLLSIHNCDSIQTLHLVVYPTYDTTIRRDICYGTTYNDGVFIESIGGLYKDTLRTIKGCDSIIHLQLNVYAQITDTIEAEICQGETYNANGFVKSVAGRYQDTTQSYLGCDSITV
jgi:hypothetical protein